MNIKNKSVNMRKRIGISILFFAVSLVSFGQVGIGNTSPKALLDISANNPSAPSFNDGVLVPRIDAFPSTSPGVDQNGMLVFLTTDNSFYYWDNAGSSWKKLADSASGWKTTGNTGTVSGTNFIGTTDDVDLDIRTNNVVSAKFKSDGDFEITGKMTGVAANLTENTITATGWYPSSAYLFTTTPPSSGDHNYFAFDTEMTISGSNDVTESDIGSAGIFATAYGGTSGTIAKLSAIEARAYSGGSGNITELNGLSGLVANDDGGGTITHAAAIRAESPYNNLGVSNMTNVYGVYIENQEFGTNNWGLYSAGTQNNYIQGNLGIGVLDPQRSLHISDVMRLEPRVGAPSVPSEGDIYVNSTDHHIYCYLGGTWKPLD